MPIFRTHNLILAISLIVLGSAPIFHTSEANADTTWDMPTAYSIGNFHTQNITWFADRVKEISNGSLEIAVHSGASLYKAPDITRAVRSNQVQIGEILMTLLSNQNPVYGIDNLPFFATNYDQAKRLSVLQRPYVEVILKKQGMIYLFSVPWPPQGFYTKKLIHSVSDMSGLNFRAYSKQTARFGELVEARPITIQAAEVTQALAIGKIDSILASSQSGVDYKVWESLEYYYDTRSWLPKNMVAVNKQAFDMLDESTQKALLQAAKESELRGWQLSERVTEQANQTLINHGIQIKPVSPKLESEFRALAKTMLDEWLSSANDDAKNLALSYMN